MRIASPRVLCTRRCRRSPMLCRVPFRSRSTCSSVTSTRVQLVLVASVSAWLAAPSTANHHCVPTRCAASAPGCDGSRLRNHGVASDCLRVRLSSREGWWEGWARREAMTLFPDPVPRMPSPGRAPPSNATRRRDRQAKLPKEAARERWTFAAVFISGIWVLYTLNFSGTPLVAAPPIDLLPACSNVSASETVSMLQPTPCPSLRTRRAEPCPVCNGDACPGRWMMSGTEFLANRTEADTAADAKAGRIPRVIHQRWRNAQLGEVLGGEGLALASSWFKCHPHWLHVLWTDEETDQLYRKRWPLFGALEYRFYPHDAQRIGTMRYLILERFGGVYLDLDYECGEGIDVLLEQTGTAHFGATVSRAAFESTQPTKCQTPTASAPGVELARPPRDSQALSRTAGEFKMSLWHRRLGTPSGALCSKSSGRRADGRRSIAPQGTACLCECSRRPIQRPTDCCQPSFTAASLFATKAAQQAYPQLAPRRQYVKVGRRPGRLSSCRGSPQSRSRSWGGHQA